MKKILCTIRKVPLVFFISFFLLAAFHDAEAKAVYVNESAVNLREERSTLSNVITILGRDEKLEVIEENSNWYRVRSIKGVGWIAKSLVSDTTPMAEELKSEKEKVQSLTEKINLLRGEIDKLRGEIDKTKKHKIMFDKRTEELSKENKRLIEENKHLSSTKDIIRVLLGIGIFVIGWLFGFLTGFYKKQSDSKRLESMAASMRH